MNKLRVFLGKICVALLVFFAPSFALAVVPANFQTTQIIGSGLSNPTGFDFAPDGRIFILQHTGEVRIYKNGVLLPQPFIVLPVINTGDRGLLGITFDPQFSTNHYVYFYYNGADSFNHVVRFDASGDVAIDSPLVLYSTNIVSQDLHMGGTIEFGPDGKLYISMGDNGRSVNAQDMSVPFGKILRLNKDGTIPSDNPFIGQANKLPEIWAYGFRNPFRFQFDKTSGKLYEGDVGEATWEEINVVTKGSNYGWPVCEGVCGVSGTTNPLFAYNHNGGSSSVTGGLVYRGAMFPSSYNGRYFYGDYAVGFLKNLTFDAGGSVLQKNDFNPAAGSVVDLKEAPDGSLYYVTIFPGRLYRVSYSTGNQIPIANAGADITKGPGPLTVHFVSAGTTDPNGDLLTYSWNFGDGTVSTNPNPVKIYNTNGTYTVLLTVSDGTDVAQAAPLIIQVGTPPTITISAPANAATYRAGDQIHYEATATDSSGNPIGGNKLSTTVFFHHQTHIHPFLGPLGGANGNFNTPTSGEESADTWFEIQVSATDDNGLVSTKSTFVYPQKVNLTFSTNVPGLKILLDGQTTILPKIIQGVVGFIRQLNVVPNQVLGTQGYLFDRWSDDGANAHSITTPNVNTTYTATFTPSTPYRAEYYNNQSLAGTPTITKTDTLINFDWDRFSPDPSIGVDHFSVRWSKTENFVGGIYQVTSTSDDGIRVYLDGSLIIDKWIDQGPTTYTSIQTITPGNHDIKVEYYENGGGAKALFSYVKVGSIVAPPPPPTGQGLSGEYFNNKDFTASTFTRVDPQVNFNWDRFSPDPAIAVDTFSVRWTGQVQPKFTETYTFYTSTDDGVRLWVNGQLLVDKWIDQGTTEWSGNIALVAGQKYNITMEYYENGGGAVARLLWSSPSNLKETIPQSQLFSTSGTLPPPPVDAYLGQYWNTPQAGSKPNFPAAQPDFTRNDSNINFVWNSGSPDPSIAVDHFVARWTKTSAFDAATYRFSVTADDGVRVYIDNSLLIDGWIDQPMTTYSADKAMTAGTHAIKIEYYENGGGAIMKFNYQTISSPPPPPPATGSGLTGQYYDNIDFTALALTQVDPTVNFNWGSNRTPNPAIHLGTFSIRWAGQVQAQNSEVYTFYTVSDDGIRLWVNDQLIIDKWVDQGDTEWSGSIPLVAGQKYTIKMDYYQNGGGAVAKLLWSSPSTAKQVIPSQNLFP
ncbi:MAG: PA14 domain-containing protein [Patescibacteria group bacterium]